MWKKDVDEPQPQPQPAAPPRSPAPQPKERATIGPSISIKGDLAGEEDLVIQGRVEGKIEVRQHNITIGKSGHVKADIYGRVISIEGEVHGNLYGEEQLILRQSGTVRGNITAPRVTLEDGANFKGSIDMTPKAMEPKRPEAGSRTQPAEASKPEKGSDQAQPMVPGLKPERVTSTV